MKKYNMLLKNIAELIEKGLFSSKDLKKGLENSINLKKIIIANKLNLVTREEFEKLTIESRKTKRADKRKQQLAMVKEHLDERDIWMGIRWMKNDYKPRPFARKGQNKDYVPIEAIAETAACYLKNEHWGKPKKNKHRQIRRQNNNRRP